MRALRMAALTAWVVALALGAGAEAQDGAAGDPARGHAVLDACSYWRGFAVCSPPVRAKTAGEAKDPGAAPGLPALPEDWAGPDFSDGAWRRVSGHLYDGYGEDGPRNVELICLRGRFAVPDPAAVKGLSFSAAYRGGIAVYLNGREVARGGLGDGKISPRTPAQEYPPESYVGPDGKELPEAGKISEEQRKRLETRIRRIRNLALPAEGLRKGVNVLAVELHRAVVDPDSKGGRKTSWGTPGLLSIDLRAEAGVEPNLVRPKGIQVWNADPMTAVFDVDYGDPNEPLRPVGLAGTRGAAFSGQVVVSSDAPIEKLRAEMGDLVPAEGAGRIPASAVRVRYALPTGRQRDSGSLFRGVRGPARFDALAESAPESVGVAAAALRKEHVGLAAVPGAVQPVWITVRVPPEAPAGDYSGKLVLSAAGLKPVEVPVRMRVAGWTAVSPREYVSHVGIVQSPESVALQYQKPLWSEEHWKLLERSLGCLGETGANALFLPLIARNHFGKESMVRWVKQAGGGYKYDFTVFDRYVDLATKNMGKPQVVCLYAWDPVYAATSRTNRGEEVKDRDTAPVLVLDPGTGEVTEMKSPFYPAPEAADFWKPVLDECRERLLKRGIPEKALMVGMAADRGPTKEEVDTFKKAAPWATWIKQAHGSVKQYSGVPIGHLAFVWGTTGLKDPDVKRGLNWDKAQIRTVFPRTGSCRTMGSASLLGECWNLQEYLVAAGYHGVGRVGADFWPVLKSAGGGTTVAGAYAEWGQNRISSSCLDLLHPGPDGALMTLRLECYRQGVLEAEARIFIERALADEARRAKLGHELAQRAQGLLDGRVRVMLACEDHPEWYESSGWQARTERLYATAAEVEKALEGR